MTDSSRKAGVVVGILTAAVTALYAAVLIRRWRLIPIATKPVELLDVPVDPLTTPCALERIEAFIRSGEPHHVFTADASGIMRAHEDQELLAIVRQADMVTADGAGVLLASKLMGQRIPERVSGADLVEQISALAAQKGYRIYLFGAADGVAETAAEALQRRHPGLKVAGVRNGFFTPEEEPGIVRAIADAHPDVLFVALGVGKQERFIRRHYHELGVPVMIGVGGSLDVAAGKLKRAPIWMRSAGLEWLYRVLQEPQRLPRLAALPKFVLAVMQERRAKCA